MATLTTWMNNVRVGTLTRQWTAPQKLDTQLSKVQFYG
ncbi:Uncharacterised protein [Klebsiella pneumoniae subsp. pneumoniae]|nr:Uncharacterised protein [Klebsiella pneumoniae subsp. pneumoniae]